MISNKNFVFSSGGNDSFSETNDFFKELEKPSVNNFFWKRRGVLDHFAQGVCQKFHLNKFVGKILASRFSDFESIQLFLKPMISTEMPNPMHLKGMKEALDRIWIALQKKEKIAIFGDYDVDGATSTALLSNYFSEIDVKTIFYIPDRIKEGYGPNEEALKKFKEEGVGLCFLVDCGSVAYAPLDYAFSIGLDVIVLDHHISLEVLPKAVALINPNRFDQESNCTNLAAVGVVFLMLVALNTFLEEKNFFSNLSSNNATSSSLVFKKKPNLMKFLDLVALGTICDVMEISGLNRAFVKKGLEVLNESTKNLGIKILLQFLNIEEKINVYHLGFIIGPRINAGGRIGLASLGANLLTSKDVSICYKISEQLNDLNEKRKLIEEISLKEAILQTYKFFAFDDCVIKNDGVGGKNEDLTKNQSFLKNQENVSIVFGSWHPGVSGLIASRIKDIYNLPSIAISFFENESVGKASCRSIPKIDIGAAVFQATQAGIIESGGGHKMAAGFLILKEKIEELRNFLNNIFSEKLESCNSHLVSEFDEYLTLEMINLAFYEQLKILEPFGSGRNSEPKFVFKNVTVFNSKIFGKKHISCLLKANQNLHSKSIRALCFGNSVKNSCQILLENPKNVDIFGSISFKNWNGREYLELVISDVRI